MRTAGARKAAREVETTESVLDAVRRFIEAVNGHDVDAAVAALTEDCVFENTVPPPDGERYEGREAIRGFFERFLADSPRATFEIEEVFAAGDRCVVRSIYRWVDRDGKPGHVRGAILFRVRDGKIAENLAYVKG